MQRKEKLLFVVNPISGYGKKDQIGALIDKYLDHHKYEYQLFKTNFPGHARELAQKAVSDETDMVIAVGGDGTINEIVNVLAKTQVKLGIIPLGSGNGLGRHVGIPLNPKKAINSINKGKCLPIDTCLVNGVTFVNMAGVGFEAYISKVFNESNERGLLTYLKCVIQHFNNYRTESYEFMVEGKLIKQRYLTIAFANSQQYGNNAYVAPRASIKDGYLDVVFVQTFPFYYWPVLIFKTLTKKLHTSRYIKTHRTKHFHLKAEHPVPMHVDGDFHSSLADFQVEIQPKSLNLIVGKEVI
ncbi:diacylglycerol kinase family lipid kinase [Fulvivirgaceae bacterium BMA12]|uniref:Diacylglycerol kinase family lipid kinase n=1 Tax=Agaribacillus aureus TaxID=3051825 RepID=A0ABT8L9M0_9BACT|nr:diacylglycerol kinase family lipid kinase [Fulvivirgaceae bacterium BMA12]